MSQSRSEESYKDLPFNPLPEQKKFMLSTADQVLLSGSFGAGKSRIGCEKGYYLNMKYPGNRGLIVRKSLKDVKSSTIQQTLLEEVIPDSHIPDGGHTKRDNIIEHYSGSTDQNGDPIFSQIYYYGVEGGRSARDDDLPEKIGSTAFGWIFVDEGTELERGEWNQLYGRLRYDGARQSGNLYKVPFRQIFTATNPDSPSHWMYEHFFNEGRGEVYQMSLNDNPHLPDDYVRNLEQNLSGMYYERYVEGRWVGAEGMVYESFDPDVHLIEKDDLPRSSEWQFHGEDHWDNDEKSVYVTPPPDWQIYRSIDFGYRNPFVCQWWARSPDDIIVMFRELYRSETLVENHARRIEALSPDGRSITKTFGDHEAESAEVLRQKAGVEVTNARKDVEAGIQAVMSRLLPSDDGSPSLYFLKGARAHKPDTNLQLNERPLKTIDEIYDYDWKDDEAKEEPVKEDDHGMDALRYFVYTLDGGTTIDEEELESWEDTFNNGDF